MAAGPLIPDQQTVYRGLRNANWSKNGAINYKAFMLRPATDQFPAERELSLGLTAESAVEDLREKHGVGSLLTGEVHALPYGLTVRASTEEPNKAYLYGLPLHSEEQEARGKAMAIATDLARLSQFIATPPQQQQN